MYAGYPEEGDECPECEEGKLIWPVVENCSCHINPPCSSCTDSKLTCEGCGWEYAPPEYKDVAVAPGLKMREYAPRKLDNTKIDWRNKMHTHFSMIKEGVYPDGIGIEKVRKEVNGSFGGRFTQFGSGTFKFIAYTD